MCVQVPCVYLLYTASTVTMQNTLGFDSDWIVSSIDWYRNKQYNNTMCNQHIFQKDRNIPPPPFPWLLSYGNPGLIPRPTQISNLFSSHAWMKRSSLHNSQFTLFITKHIGGQWALDENRVSTSHFLCLLSKHPLPILTVVIVIVLLNVDMHLYNIHIIVWIHEPIRE